MLIQLTEYFTTEGKVSEEQIELSMEQFFGQSGEFPIKEKSPLQLKLSNIGKGKVLVEGKVTFCIMMPCDRCLTPVEQIVALSFNRQVLAPSEGKDKLTEDELDDQSFMVGYQLDVESLVSSEITMDWPRKVLCSSDCKGICMICGKNRNDGECGCDTFVPDPRMAKIKDIFNAK